MSPRDRDERIMLAAAGLAERIVDDLRGGGSAVVDTAEIFDERHERLYAMTLIRALMARTGLGYDDIRPGMVAAFGERQKSGAVAVYDKASEAGGAK